MDLDLETGPALHGTEQLHRSGPAANRGEADVLIHQVLVEDRPGGVDVLILQSRQKHLDDVGLVDVTVDVGLVDVTAGRAGGLLGHARQPR